MAAFEKELWITLIGVWAILLMSLQVRLLLLPKNVSSAHSSSSSIKDYRFSKESVLWSVAIVCQKSWYLNPYSTTLRMKVILGTIVSLIVYTAYSASIVSSLAVNKIPVKTFTDLISFSFIFTVHEKSEPFQTILRGILESFDLSQELVTISTENEISHLITDSKLDVQSSKNAFVSPADMFYQTAKTLKYSDTFICNHISSVAVGPALHKRGPLVTKGSHHKEVLNHM
ncbi:unnamed protein product [Orchesella dallaii]|uniref:Ionotropic glutamate receptor C-terminal domain-containing protein n=1 Tax=Orchesella dallaii TaxID=48710 RepID=A0ABP1Q4I8_9HEXA